MGQNVEQLFSDAYQRTPVDGCLGEWGYFCYTAYWIVHMEAKLYGWIEIYKKDENISKTVKLICSDPFEIYGQGQSICRPNIPIYIQCAVSRCLGIQYTVWRLILYRMFLYVASHFLQKPPSWCPWGLWPLGPYRRSPISSKEKESDAFHVHVRIVRRRQLSSLWLRVEI